MRTPQHTRLAHARYAKGGKLTPWADATVPAPTIPLGSRRDPVIPLVSSGVPGPLELLHLPRLWLEGVLRATQRIDPAFAGGNALFDELLCECIGVDRAALHAFLQTVPDYLACERWLRTHANRLNPSSIAQVNNAISKAREDGVPVLLRDDLRAWDALHASLVARRGTPLEPIVPAISSRTCGALGVDHLPRLWLKNLLKANGALPIGYRSGLVRVMERGLAYVSQGIDTITYGEIGLDVRTSVAFLESTLPAYAAYEAWVERHATQLDTASLAWHNLDRGDARPLKAIAEKAYAGWDDPTTWGYIIDDLIDWRLLYEVITGAPTPAWTGP